MNSVIVTRDFDRAIVTDRENGLARRRPSAARASLEFNFFPRPHETHDRNACTANVPAHASVIGGHDQTAREITRAQHGRPGRKTNLTANTTIDEPPSNDRPADKRNKTDTRTRSVTINVSFRFICV